MVESGSKWCISFLNEMFIWCFSFVRIRDRGMYVCFSSTCEITWITFSYTCRYLRYILQNGSEMRNNSRDKPFFDMTTRQKFIGVFILSLIFVFFLSMKKGIHSDIFVLITTSRIHKMLFDTRWKIMNFVLWIFKTKQKNLLISLFEFLVADNTEYGSTVQTLIDLQTEVCSFKLENIYCYS